MKNIVRLVLTSIFALVATHYALEMATDVPEILTLIGRISISVAFHYGIAVKEAAMYVSYVFAGLTFCTFYGLTSVVSNTIDSIESAVSGLFNLVTRKEA